MTEVRSVTLDMASADADAVRIVDAVVAVTLALTLRDSEGTLRERSVILTLAEETSIDNLAAMLPDLIASVRNESLAPALPPPDVDVDEVIELDSFDFDSLIFDRNG